jgi:hypothetical protein
MRLRVEKFIKGLRRFLSGQEGFPHFTSPGGNRSQIAAARHACGWAGKRSTDSACTDPPGVAFSPIIDRLSGPTPWRRQRVIFTFI